MQYAVMVDLIAQAKLAGAREIESLRDSFDSVFENWFNRQDFREITVDEMEALRGTRSQGVQPDKLLFIKGLQICPFLTQKSIM